MDNQSVFLNLVRLGIGLKSSGKISINSDSDWNSVFAIAGKQGLSAIMLDGLEGLSLGDKLKQKVFLKCFEEVIQSESIYAIQQKAAAEMALLFHSNGIRTYVLKGAVIAECYPKPEHRNSVDMDCFLLTERKDLDAWAFGNDLIKTNGFDVLTDFYKNSTFCLPGLTVENHRFLTPFRGNRRLKSLELLLQSMIKNDLISDSTVEERIIEGTWLYRPPVMVTSLFLIEHSYSHFLHEGLTWRHILDWMMFSRKHNNEIDWDSLDALIDEFGFRKFYKSYYNLGQYLIGDIKEDDLTIVDKKMLRDVWNDLDCHETMTGIKGRIASVGNTCRAWWKYRYFSEISMIHDLWNQVKGVLFLKNPTLY